MSRFRHEEYRTRPPNCHVSPATRQASRELIRSKPAAQRRIDRAHVGRRQLPDRLCDAFPTQRADIVNHEFRRLAQAVDLVRGDNDTKQTEPGQVGRQRAKLLRTRVTPGKAPPAPSRLDVSFRSHPGQWLQRPLRGQNSSTGKILLNLLVPGRIRTVELARQLRLSPGLCLVNGLVVLL
jgi:hypothetical protein